jgi:hypothetical protein
VSGIEAVLAEHASTRIVYVAVPRRPEIRQLTYVCTCGVTLDAAVTKGEAHRKHVAAAVEVIVTRAVNEALTEAADEIDSAANDFREAADLAATSEATKRHRLRASGIRMGARIARRRTT